MTSLKLLLVCSILLHVFDACDGVCLTIKTKSGTDYPEACVFPFTFKGKTYYSCTTDYDKNSIPW
jgi:hypothetical protein